MAADPGSLDKLRCGSSTHLLKGKIRRTESRVLSGATPQFQGIFFN